MGAVELSTGVEVRLGLGVQVRLVDEVVVVMVVVVGVVGVVVVVVVVVGMFVESRTEGPTRTMACLFLCGLFGCFGLGAVELSTGVEIGLGLGVLMGLVGEVMMVVVVVVGVIGVVVVVVVIVEVVVMMFVLL
jgi:hypothetical protein